MLCRVFTLGDLQRNVGATQRPGEIASELRATVGQLILITEIEDHREARNLVSAELLAELLRGICRYCNARGWNADRLIETAMKSESQP